MKSTTPPYGKPLKALLATGFRPSNDVYIFCGLRAWEKARDFSLSWPDRTLCLPPWIDPIGISWPVSQCGVLVHDTLGSDQDYIDLVAACAYRDGASAVRYVSEKWNLTVYEKDFI